MDSHYTGKCMKLSLRTLSRIIPSHARHFRWRIYIASVVNRMTEISSDDCMALSVLYFFIFPSYLTSVLLSIIHLVSNTCNHGNNLYLFMYGFCSNGLMWELRQVCMHAKYVNFRRSNTYCLRCMLPRISPSSTCFAELNLLN